MIGDEIIARLDKILNFWEGTHEVLEIHAHPTTRRALAQELRKYGVISDGMVNGVYVLKFRGYDIHVHPLDGHVCYPDSRYGSVTAPCFSVVIGEPLPVVQDKATAEYMMGVDFAVPDAERSTFVTTDKNGNVLYDGMALLKMGTLTHDEFCKLYQAEWVPDSNELPPEGYVWE